MMAKGILLYLFLFLTLFSRSAFSFILIDSATGAKYKTNKLIAFTPPDKDGVIRAFSAKSLRVKKMVFTKNGFVFGRRVERFYGPFSHRYSSQSSFYASFSKEFGFEWTNGVSLYRFNRREFNSLKPVWAEDQYLVLSGKGHNGQNYIRVVSGKQKFISPYLVCDKLDFFDVQNEEAYCKTKRNTLVYSFDSSTPLRIFSKHLTPISRVMNSRLFLATNKNKMGVYDFNKSGRLMSVNFDTFKQDYIDKSVFIAQSNRRVVMMDSEFKPFFKTYDSVFNIGKNWLGVNSDVITVFKASGDVLLKKKLKFTPGRFYFSDYSNVIALINDKELKVINSLGIISSVKFDDEILNLFILKDGVLIKLKGSNGEVYKTFGALGQQLSSFNAFGNGMVVSNGRSNLYALRGDTVTIKSLDGKTLLKGSRFIKGVSPTLQGLILKDQDGNVALMNSKGKMSIPYFKGILHVLDEKHQIFMQVLK